MILTLCLRVVRILYIIYGRCCPAWSISCDIITEQILVRCVISYLLVFMTDRVYNVPITCTKKTINK